MCELDRADTHAIVSNFPCVFNTEMERLKKVIKKRGGGLREEKRKRKIVETRHIWIININNKFHLITHQMQQEFHPFCLQEC